MWHLGSVYAASLAKMGFQVTGFDLDTNVIDNLKKGIPPIFEPDLEETIKAHADRLSFSSDVADLENKDYVFMTLDVEVDDQDVAQMDIAEKIFSIFESIATENTTIVISSQIPVGTSRMLVDRLKAKGIERPRVLYFPENLRLGSGFATFLTPDRIILGSDNEEAILQFEADFAFPCPVIGMGLESAEFVKHALNCYLATCISFSSELSDLAERVGANMFDVVKAMKSDKRVSLSAPLNPGLGFAGGTLGRDVQALRKIATEKKYDPKFLDAVYSVNRDRLPMLIEKITNIVPDLNGKKVGVLGLTYKPNTDTLRRSMSLELMPMLHEKKCAIRAYDPAIKTSVGDIPYLEIAATTEDFAKDLDLIVLMTDWPEFRDVDPVAMCQHMRNCTIIDTKNFLDASRYRAAGFKYVGMGIE